MDISDLLRSGFIVIGEWCLIDGELQLSANASAELERSHAVYVFREGLEILYIGVTLRALSRRMKNYLKPGASQRTSRRLNALITERLHDGAKIEVLAFWPGRTDVGGLPVDVAPGLETALISLIRPGWNMKGAGKRVPLPQVPGSDLRADSTYWVYVNDVIRKCRIHKSTCPYCNSGRGLHGGGDRQSSYWRSFVDRQGATDFAENVGHSDVRTCTHCGG
tara:strand:- start:350 stop:1012 length:663 start_codon:yes stop_codon:yes gene_type:complete